MKKQITIVLLLILVVVIVKAEPYTISGYMKDEKSGESLIGATVFDHKSGKGAVSNVHGFYSLTVEGDSVDLEYSYVMYSAERRRFELSEDTVLTVVLRGVTELDEVTLVGNRNEIGVRGTQMSAIEVPIAQIKNIPALVGEVDIIKALQLLPGVQSGSEGATGMYVRGGGPDQNLVLLDGVPLYNINHLFGFFSVFNADAIKNVTLYKGNFPARFGSRLSSVIDVRQNEGNEQEYHGNVTVGLLSAKLNVEGPIIKGKTTFNVSARRTYFDALAQPILALAQAQSESKAFMGYYFYDVNAKVTHKFSDKDKLSASFYMGDDAIYSTIKEEWEGEKRKMKFSWNWGNLLGSLNWAHQFSNRLFSTLTMSYTRYRYSVEIDQEGNEGGNDTKMNIGYHSNIQDMSVLYDFDYAPHPNHSIKFGGNYVYHIFKPEVGSYQYEESGGMDVNQKSGGEELGNHELALYIEDNWSINNIFKLNLGLRGTLYAVQDKVYPSLEPRLGFRSLLTKDLSVKASYSYMNQYIHLLSGSSVTLPTDLWVPVTSKIPPMNSHQGALGVFYNLLGQVDFSLEGYYKQMDNILEYKDGASFFASTEGWEDKVCLGEGWSYGVEFLAQRSIGKFTGWVGYTWSKAERKFDRDGMEINDGEVFYAKYDRRHDLSVVAQYKINKIVDVSGTFVYGTGTRASLGTQEYVDGDGAVYEYLPERNNFRLPDYIRLDVGVNFYKQHKRGKSIVNVSVYNLTNRNNPFFVYGDDDALMQMSIFPILPSVSYTYKF